MSNTIRDLIAWYPLLPSGTAPPDAVSKILDMKIIVCLEPVDTQYDQVYNSPEFSFQLLSISGGSATVRRVCPLAGEPANMTINVYVGRDACPPSGESYIVVSESVSWTGSAEVHPDCVLFMQRAPVLTFYATSLTEAFEVAHTACPMLPLSFADGHNMQVEHSSGVLRFISGSGYGLGIFTEPPGGTGGVVVDAPAAQISKGLRSINGLTGDVRIHTDSTMQIEVDSSGGPVFLTLILPEETAEELPT